MSEKSALLFQVSFHYICARKYLPTKQRNINKQQNYHNLPTIKICGTCHDVLTDVLCTAFKLHFSITKEFSQQTRLFKFYVIHHLNLWHNQISKHINVLFIQKLKEAHSISNNKAGVL